MYVKNITKSNHKNKKEPTKTLISARDKHFKHVSQIELSKNKTLLPTALLKYNLTYS